MNCNDFNEKYKDYLEDGHYGMSICDSEIINLCDEYFQEWIKIPGFSYAQIKTKFGHSRVYCEKVSTTELEDKINKILKERRDKQ